MTFRVFLLGMGSAFALSLATLRGTDAGQEATRAPAVGAPEAIRLTRAVLMPRADAAPWGDTVPLYTAEQLASGTALYEKVCKECHEDADYTNEKFRTKWSGKTLNDLFEEIRTKMPEDNPGSLTRDQYAEAMSYILKLNGVPAGPNRIAPDSAAMSAVTLNFLAKAPLAPSHRQ